MLGTGIIFGTVYFSDASGGNFKLHTNLESFELWCMNLTWVSYAQSYCERQTFEQS